MTTKATAETTPPKTLKTLTTTDGFLTLKRIDQGGALQARRLSSDAIQFYWRYTHNGKTHRVAIGIYDPSAPPRSLSPSPKGYSIAAASEACSANARVQHETALEGGYQEQVARRKAAHAAVVAQRQDAQKHSLRMLLASYADYLQADGKRSHGDARSLFRLHVEEAWPAVADRAAVDVTAADLLEMFRKLIDAKKGRTANKLRAYIRAAYQCALDVHSLPSVPVAFKSFRITTNPAALTKRVAKHDRADKNPLSVADLRAYWLAIKPLPGAKGAALRLHLLSGGQRIEQLVKLIKSDIGPDSFCIFDNKGRPGSGARRHTVPLLPGAREAVKHLEGEGPYLFSTNDGATPLSAVTLSSWAKEVSGGIADFQLKRVRSGVETLLAAAGVSKDIRGHLQSHGLSGIQARHYDDHDYLPEKRRALETLLEVLESTARHDRL